MPALQEQEEDDPDLEELFPGFEEEEDTLPTPSKRLRDKTTVRFIDGNDKDKDDSEYLAKVSMLDGDVSEASFLKIVEALEKISPQSQDRRGELKGKLVIGAYSHGGNRGITSMCKSHPVTTQFLNKFLQARIGPQVDPPTWSTLMIMHASDVTVHRDHRNGWGSRNHVLSVAGPVQLWVGPPKDPKINSSQVSPEWSSPTTVSLGGQACSFDPRNYHAVRKSPDWVLVGYTPLGTRKTSTLDHRYLAQVGFPIYPCDREIQVKVVKPENPEPEPEGSNDSASPGVQGDLGQDLQSDANTTLVGWDLSEGATRNYPAVDLPDADLHRF